MKINNILNKLTFSTLALALVIGSPAFSLASAVTTDGEVTEANSCYTLTLTSDGNTQTAGYTETAQTGPETALLAASYSNLVFGSAVPTEAVIPPWVDPTVDANFIGSNAAWISSHTSWPGGTDNTEGSSANDQWRLFRDSFTLPELATVDSAEVHFTADNAVGVYLNGNNTPIATTNGVDEEVYGPTPVAGNSNYAQVYTAPFSPTSGVNTLDFVVRNWSADNSTNPTGLLYKAVVNYCVPNPEEPQEPGDDVQVIIHKFVQQVMATESSADGMSFPMSSTWDADNVGAGTGEYALDDSNVTPYEAMTVEMTSGADYTTHEILSGDIVGASCEDGKPFALEGYTSGSTKAEAMGETPTLTPPAFTNMQTDKHVIVWNRDCALAEGEIEGEVNGGSSSEGELAVTSIAPVDTNATADNSYENGWSYVFNITVPTDETNLSMKFADWFSVPTSSTILAGGNMQISSLQANNGNAPVNVAAANTYTAPALTMTGDLDPAAAGLQVQVLVQVKIPVGSVNGSYTTTYGVQTLP